MRWNTVSSGHWVRVLRFSSQQYQALCWHQPYLTALWKSSPPYYVVTLWCKLKFSLHEAQAAVVICADTIKLKSRSQDMDGINPAWPLDIAKASVAREIPRKLQEQLWTCLWVITHSLNTKNKGLVFQWELCDEQKLLYFLRTRTDDGTFMSAFCHGKRKNYLLHNHACTNLIASSVTA